MIKQSLVWLYSAVTYLLWSVVIVVAFTVLVMRYYVLPHATDYRVTIEKYVSDAAGQRITIGDIKAGWDGMNPYFDLLKVDVHDAQGRPALHLDLVSARLSWTSLPLAEPRLSELTIRQPNLLIRRAPNREIFVAGISLNAPGKPEFPDWLLRQSTITVTDATVVWQDDLRQAPPLSLNQLNLTISNPFWESLLGHHEFGLRAIPSAGTSAPIDVRGNLWGKSVGRPDEWHGTIFARLEGTDIAAWKTWLDYPFELNEGYGATQFWLDFANSRINRITADVLVTHARLRMGKVAPETLLDELSGRLTWKKEGNAQDFSGNKLNIKAASGFGIKQGHLHISTTLSGSNEIVAGEIAVDDINLESFTNFATVLPLGESIQNQLLALRPRGNLLGSRFSWKGNHSEIRQYRLESRFTNLSIQPFNGMPGFSNLSGNLRSTEKDGDLSINSTRASLDVKGVLRWPIPADTLTGKVHWETSNAITQVTVNQLSIANPHIRGKLDASYRHDGVKGGYLDLKGNFGNADGRYAKFYYPLILSKDTLNWLDTSILSGRGENVNVVIKGYLDDFPYTDGKNGEFKVSARITDGVVDYANGWPIIDGIHLDMLFHGDRMDLNVSQARVYNAQIGKTRISIPVLDAQHPVLQIQGSVLTSAADALKYIDNSPIDKAIEGFTSGMRATGNGNLQLDLQIPLDNVDATRVKGSFSMDNVALTPPKPFPELEQINGKISFTESGVYGQNVKAMLYGSPANLSFETGAKRYMHLKADGRMNADGLRKMVSWPVLQRIVGATEWDGEITVRNALADMTFHSSLSGLTFSLPPPLNKSSDETLPLALELHEPDAKRDIVKATLGNRLSMILLRTDNKTQERGIERGEVKFGGQSSMPDQPGIWLNGKIPRIDFDAWNRSLDKTKGPSTVTGANLEIGALDVFGKQFNSLNISAKSTPEGWAAKLQGNEVNGEFVWKNQGSGKLIARLKSFTIPGPAPATIGEQSVKELDQDLPSLDIVADEFVAKNRKLGRLELLASQQGPDWNIDKLSISNPESTLNVNGKWQSWKNKPVTNISLNWNIEDLGKTLDRFGYTGTVKGGNGNLAGQLDWPGGPSEFNLAGLNGNLALEVKQGQFLKIQPGVGRLLGILSLQNLPRRLMFDFRDVFNDGFTFDSIGGTIKIDRGVMQSKNFKMEGPPAKVAISGETHLERETLNLHVKVTPSISDTLSLAAFAGGPVAGAAAFVAQKLLQDPLNKLASYEYDIGGTWDDPQEVKTSQDKNNTKPAASPLPGK